MEQSDIPYIMLMWFTGFILFIPICWIRGLNTGDTLIVIFGGTAVAAVMLYMYHISEKRQNQRVIEELKEKYAAK